ncbi:type I-E CRISPR-associated protein Cse2/CasB [Pararhodospirillum photometricum]|nr:type I-E CRISPR-associated protein Cse2/CasB [Pararhodospirillum photometricum]
MSSERAKYLNFSKEESATTTLPVLKAWHARLADDRRARAALRRAQSLDDVWPEEAFSRLRLHLLPLASFSTMALARVAVAVAEVDEDHEVSLARRAASLGVRGKALVSSDRLRLLLGSEDPDEFLRLLRGIVDQIDRQVNVAALADLVLSWEHPNGRLWARRTVFLDYYETAPADA